MFLSITNTPRPYAWGSTTMIPELLGTPVTGEPEAELWLGAHSGSPSVIVDPAQAGGATDLAAWIAADPTTALGDRAGGARLPFLLKLLAAASPLSLQAHPTAAEAREGFRLENEKGVPLDAPHRNYKDAYPKPELIYALSETFDALCGFRPLAQFREIVEELRDAADDSASLDDLLARAQADDSLPGLVGWLSLGGSEVDAVVASVSDIAARATSDRFATEFATSALLAREYPGDPGIVVSLLLNRVTLKRGEVLYLPAGNIHAYLFGLGVELMTASDNVLRGGLTPKYVDVPELLSVLDLTPTPIPYLHAERPVGGVEVFRPDVPDFVLVHFTADTAADARSYSLTGPAIAVCTSDSVEVRGAASVTSIARGEALYITPDEGTVTVSGAGELFLATTGTA